MGKLLTRMWRYVTALLTGRFNELADPKVQLEQALQEAQEQHRRLKEQAANVIANQKQTELRLDRALEELEKLNGNAQQALLMAEDARRSGDDDKAAGYEHAAETIATTLVTVEAEVEDLTGLHLQAVTASDQAKAAVAQNSMAVQRKLAERAKLLSQLDQAKMAEQMNAAMSTLSATVGEDVPTFEEVRDKIERRMAAAQGRSELESATVEARVLEVEQAQRNVEAQKRLSELRSKLGIASVPTQAAGAPTEPATEPGEEATADQS